VQEYKLLGDGKWQFYATRSKHDRLNQEQGFNRYQSAILVYWKIGGKEVEDQHLVYLKAPLTRDLLDNLDDEWLEENGIKLSINELLAAPKQAVVKRGDSPTDKGADNTDNSGLPLTHTVKLDPATRQRESWPAIAEQYGLSAKQLLSLNPKYNSNPMLLKAGEELIVQEGSAPQQQEHIYGWPSVDTKKYNNLSNVIYDYSVSNLNGSSIKSVNAKSVAQDELPIVNVREIEIPVEFHLGFSIVEETRSLHDFWKEELRGSPSRIQNLIKEHNQHLNDPVVPGEIVIFLTTEPYLNEQDLKLNTLKENATLASAQLGTLTPEQAEIHHTYFEVIENKLIEYWGSGKPSDTFSALGGAIGTIAPAMQENMKNVSSSLKKIDNLYLDLLSKKIARKVFIQKRQELQTLLNKQLDKLTQKTLRIPIDRGLKNSLGINSTKSILHHADEILSKGSVSALGERIANTAKWIKYTEDAGRVAIGLSVASGAYNVTQNCDDLESCARGTLVEAGGVVGGWAGGTAGAYIGGAIVALIGAASAPVVMAVVGAATLGFGIIGAGVGKDAVKRSYKLIKLDEILEEIETNIENGIPSSVEEYINKERFNDFSVGSIF
jgi:LysM domain.